MISMLIARNSSAVPVDVACRYNTLLYAQYGLTSQAAIWDTQTGGANPAPFVLAMQTVSLART